MKFRRPCVLLLLLTVLACGSEPPAPLVVGSRAPSFELPDLQGGTLESNSLEGRPTVVVFWATWCLPCLEEIPLLNELADSGEAQIVAISLDDAEPETVRQFAEDHGLKYPVVMGNEEIFRRYEGFTIPYTLVLDSDFSLVAKHRGRLTAEVLRSEIRGPAGVLGEEPTPDA